MVVKWSNDGNSVISVSDYVPSQTTIFSRSGGGGDYTHTCTLDKTMILKQFCSMLDATPAAGNLALCSVNLTFPNRSSLSVFYQANSQTYSSNVPRITLETLNISCPQGTTISIRLYNVGVWQGAWITLNELSSGETIQNVETGEITQVPCGFWDWLGGKCHV